MAKDSKIDKLVEKTRNSMKNVRFDDLTKILNFIGYECIKRNSGSHHTFRKKGCLPITIPKDNPVNPTYVRKVLEAYDDNVSDF